MGTVVGFTGGKGSLRTVAPRLGQASALMRLVAERLREARVHLQSAEASGERALDRLDKCLENLEWTDGFCRQCLAATDLQDIEEMVRQRDELADVMQQKVTIERRVESLRFASAR